MPEEKGLLIVYTGPARAKPPARSAPPFAPSAGPQSPDVQFIKGSCTTASSTPPKCSATTSLKSVRWAAASFKIGGAETDPADIKLAEECWQAGRDAIYGGKYDLVVLDEINYTISYKMLDAAEVVEALKRRPERVHVICTGRNAHPSSSSSPPRHRDARGETPVHQGYTGSAGDRLLEASGSRVEVRRGEPSNRRGLVFLRSTETNN